MERPYTGLTALMKIGGEKVGYLNSLELSLEKDIIEILQFGAQYKEKIPAIKNWTASAEGYVAFAAGESQHKLYQAYESGELIELDILLNEVTKFTGNALVSSLSISAAPDDALTISASFEGSGGNILTLPQTFFVDVVSGVGGTTEPAGSIRIVAEGDLVVDVKPSAGKVADVYYLDDDTVGKVIDENNKIELTDITSDHKIKVTFKAKSAPSGGALAILSDFTADNEIVADTIVVSYLYLEFEKLFGYAFTPDTHDYKIDMTINGERKTVIADKASDPVGTYCFYDNEMQAEPLQMYSILFGDNIKFNKKQGVNPVEVNEGTSLLSVMYIGIGITDLKIHSITEVAK